MHTVLTLCVVYHLSFISTEIKRFSSLCVFFSTVETMAGNSTLDRPLSYGRHIPFKTYGSNERFVGGSLAITKT